MEHERSTTIIRHAVEDDLDVICKLWRQLFEMHAELDPIFTPAPDGEFHYRLWMANLMTQHDAFIHVAQRDDEVVAYCQSQIRSLPPTLIYRRIGVVADMVVDERYRNRGIGRQLYAHVERLMRQLGVDRMELKTSTFNPQSNAFWENTCGFREFLKTRYKEFG